MFIKKFDMLSQIVKEKTDNSEIKDILNYIVGQITVMNENSDVMKNNQQSNSEVLVAVAENVSGFNANIEKLVSYIDE